MIAPYKFPKISIAKILVLCITCYVNQSYGALGGIYTLNPAAPASATNYQTLGSFATDLYGGGRADSGPVNGAGISSSVTLLVASGLTLNEQVEFRAVTGASATRTITIKGNLSTVQFTATVNTSKHTIWLNGAKFYTIDSLNVNANSATLAWGIRFSNDASNNIIRNCSILCPNITTGVGTSTTSTSTQAAICFTASASVLDYTANSATSGGVNGSNNLIANCTIGGSSSRLGPTYGIYEIQTSSTGNNSYVNNKIQHYYQEGLACHTADGITITGNDINRMGNSTTPGVTHKGINIYNNVRCTNKPITISNNIIHDITTSSTLYGFYHINSSTYMTNEDGGTQQTIFQNNRIYNLTNTTTQYCAYFSSIRNSGGYSIKNNEIFKNSNTSTMYCMYNSNSDKAVLEGNIVRSNKASTIYCMYDLSNSTNSSFINNLIFKNVATSVEYGMRLNGTGASWLGNNYSNNTIAFDSTGWVSSTTYGMYINGGVGYPNSNNTVFNNNIFMGHKGTSSTTLKYGIYNLNGYSGYTEERNNVYFDTANISPSTIYYGTEYSGPLIQIPTLAQWINLGFSNKDFNENPHFIKSYYGDYRTANMKLHNIGSNSGVTKDIAGVNRLTGTPDIGAFETVTDMKALFSNNYNSVVCAGFTDSVNMTVSNNSGMALKNLTVGLLLNNALYSTATLRDVPTGNSLVVFPNTLTFTKTGLNTIKWFVTRDNISTSDDTITKTTTVSAPGGSVFGLKSGSKGILNHALGYDVTAFDENITYTMTSPSKYTDLEFGSKWIVQTWATNAGGTVLPGSVYTFTHPSNTELVFKPSIAYVDQVITLHTRIIDLVTTCDTVFKRNIFVAPKGVITINVPTSVCYLTDVDFVNTSTISSGDLTYTWDFGDGSDLYNGKFAKHTYSAAGVYNVTLTATSVPFGFVSDTTFQVEVKEIPKANFTKVNACEGNNIILTNTSTVKTGTPTYEWDFGDGSPVSTSKDPVKTYAAPGIYKVTLTVAKSGCSNTISKTVYQFARPDADFVKTSGECVSTPVSFANTSTLAVGQGSSLWSFGDGNTSTDPSPTHTFASAGNKNVKLVFTSEFGCRDSITRVINVKEAPVSNFTNLPACDATPTAFTNTSDLKNENLSSYIWDFGDGTTSSATNPVKSWASAGTRVVKLKTTLQNGCSSEVSKTIVVGIQPTVDFNLTDACSGSPVNFENLTEYNPNKINYSWKFGDNSPVSSDNSPTHTYTVTSTQTFTVKLVGTVINGCSDSVSKTITITALPTTCNFDIVGSTGAATKTIYQFNPKGGNMSGVTYTWVTGDGNTVSSNGAGATYTYDAPGIYCVKMTAKNVGGCVCEATKCITLTTSIDNAGSLDKALAVYPNPSNGVFTVALNAEKSEGMKISVYNTVGKLVKTVSADTGKANVDLTGYAPGVYMVKVSANSYTVTRKITITK